MNLIIRAICLAGIASGAAAPACAEALFDQSPVRVFAVRAAALESPATGDASGLRGMPSVGDEADEREVQVPGSVVWTVLSPVPAPVAAYAAAVEAYNAGVGQAAPHRDPADPKGPRVW